MSHLIFMCSFIEALAAAVTAVMIVRESSLPVCPSFLFSHANGMEEGDGPHTYSSILASLGHLLSVHALAIGK